MILSARNLQGARVVVASELSTYDIMNANGVLIVKEANDLIGEHPHQVSHQAIDHPTDRH